MNFSRRAFLKCGGMAAGELVATSALPALADDSSVFPDMSKFTEKINDDTTRDFVAYLRAQPLLKGILCGHGHYGVVDQFSKTAKQYMVAANFFFHGQEFTIR